MTSRPHPDQHRRSPAEDTLITSGMDPDAVARRVRHLVSDTRSAVTALGDALTYRRSFEARVETAQTLGLLALLLSAARDDTVLETAQGQLQTTARDVQTVVGDVQWDTRMGQWRLRPPVGR